MSCQDVCTDNGDARYIVTAVKERWHTTLLAHGRLRVVRTRLFCVHFPCTPCSKEAVSLLGTEGEGGRAASVIFTAADALKRR